MADDKTLVEAYASIYNNKDETEQLDELAPVSVVKMGLKAKENIGNTINKVKSTVRQGKALVGNIKDRITGANNKVVPATNSSKAAKGSAPNAPSPTSPQMNSYEPEGEVVSEIKAPPNQDLERRIDKIENKTMSPGEKVLKALTKKPPVVYANAPKKTNEDVAITHLDGSTTEIVDVVKPEALGEPDEKLASRLWDQVAANLDTLGEMYGASFDVVELEEKMADKDYDGDGKVESSTDEYMGSRDKAIKKAMGKKEMKKEVKEAKNGGDNDPCWDSHKQVGMKKKGGKMVPNCVPKESFNVKSPVVFSKPEKKTEDTISEETIEKYASSISKAHKAIKK